MDINNRRYIGCKTKLLKNIYDSISCLGYSKSSSFADLFSGTGVVGYFFAEKGFKTLVNDTLYSNFISYNAWMGNENFSEKKIDDTIDFFNNISSASLKNNYFSNIYGGKYFSVNDAKKIGFIRDYLEDHKTNFSKREFCILLTSLMYSTDKIANTVGHFESFLHKIPDEKGVVLQKLSIKKDIAPVEIFNEDANKLAGKIKYDIVYIDPPYNARQYINFYHVLENLARWNKPTVFEGNSMKFQRNELKSDYCRNKAPELFKELISSLDCKLIVVSYNNTYKAGSISSINTISEEQIKEILESKGKLSVKEINYKSFNSGKTKLEGHKEYLYICEVK